MYIQETSNKVNVSQVLNQILCELPAEHPLAESRPLRELLGHTPTQVQLDAFKYCFEEYFLNHNCSCSK